MPNVRMIPILPSRKIYFRAHGKRIWKVHTLTVLGKKSCLDPVQSMKPMQLTLETDIEGFRSIQLVGMELYSALTSTLLSIESLIFFLRKDGEVRLNKDLEFEVDVDSIFFGKRLQQLRKSLLKNQTPAR
jgi:hypothetical protein